MVLQIWVLKTLSSRRNLISYLYAGIYPQYGNIFFQTLAIEDPQLALSDSSNKSVVNFLDRPIFDFENRFSPRQLARRRLNGSSEPLIPTIVQRDITQRVFEILDEQGMTGVTVSVDDRAEYLPTLRAWSARVRILIDGDLYWYYFSRVR